MGIIVSLLIAAVVVLVVNKLLDEAEHRRMRDLSQRVSDWNDDIQRTVSEHFSDEAERERQRLSQHRDQKPPFDEWEREWARKRSE